MAQETFELLISYPDSHVEVIEETFPSVEKAREYGVSMMNQIRATEQFHVKSGDILERRHLKKPYFEIYQVVDGSRKLVEKRK